MESLSIEYLENNGYEKHYGRYLHIYKNLSTIYDAKTSWIPTDKNYGWYVNSSVTKKKENEEAWEKGYTKKSRPRVIPDDLDSDIERTAYATIDYAEDSVYNTRYWKDTEDGRQWLDKDRERLPDYGDIKSWALFVDIDISDEYKVRPLKDSHKATIRDRLSYWVNVFEKMCGGISPVHILDSGGGMYVFSAPSCLKPIYDTYDSEDRGLIFKEIGERMRVIVGTLNSLICAEDDMPDDLFSADKVQNKNRQYKVIGSVHKSLDAVVNPVNPENINIQHKKVSDISESDIDEAREWVNSFTSEDYEQRINDIINYLFQGEFTENETVDVNQVDGESWEDILDNWLERKKQSIRSWQERQNRIEDISEEDINTDITADKEVSQAAITKVNNQKLKDYIISYLGTDNVYENSGGEMDFFPFWRSESTKSGRSAFYDEFYEGKARFTDKSDGSSCDITDWVALELTYDDENYPDKNLLSEPGDSLSSSGYAQVIEELRNRGEQIPIYIPEDEQIPRWRVINVGKELDIIGRTEEVDGKEIVVNPKEWNKTLEKIENEGIEHGRDRINLLRRTEIMGTDIEKSKFGYKSIPGVESGGMIKKLLDSLPEEVIIFYTTEEFGNSVPDEPLLGVSKEQDSEVVRFHRAMPVSLVDADTIEIREIPLVSEVQNISKDSLVVMLRHTELH